MSGLVTTLIILGVVVVLALYVLITYNSLVSLRIRVNEAWSDITVQLKRRADLIPSIVDAVRGYAGHEKSVFEAVTEARAETISAQSPAEATIAEGHMQQALKSIFAVAEAYPQLQASQSFLQLQTELVDTENKIQASRRFFNGGVREYNTKLQIFPNNLFAKMFGFEARDFFEVDNVAAISEPPRIQF
jgi:LemA protein